MSLFKIEVYIDEIFFKTAFIEATDQYEAEEQVRSSLSIDLDSELADA